MNTSTIGDILKMQDGQQVRFEAMIDKIFPPKVIRKNGSSFSIQEVILSDGRETVSLSTFDQVASASVGKKALITGSRSDWRDRSRVLHRTLKGRIEVLVNGNGKAPQERQNPAPAVPPPANGIIHARDEYERRDLWILFQSSLKSAAELVRGVAPLCKNAEDLAKMADVAKTLVIQMAGEFLRTVSAIKADNSLPEIRKFLEKNRIPADVVGLLLANTGAKCLCELTEEQRKSMLDDLKETVRKYKAETDT